MHRIFLVLVPLCAVCVICGDPALYGQTFSDQGSTWLPFVNHNSRSASLADYDDDGDLDLLFQGGDSSQLYRNNIIGTGSTSFTNISNQLPTGLNPSWSAAWGDYNSDGRVDVFVGQSNVLASQSGDVLENHGGLFGFSNQSVATGLDDAGFHQNVAWSDIDNDQDLDLLIAMEGPTEKHEIYLQEDNGTFTPVGASVGFQADFGTKAYGMAIGDTDGDGDMDVYISTCIGTNFIRNNFYQNMLVETGSLSFVDIADTNGTQFMTNSYGSEFHDFDDDGDLDLFMVGADTEPSKIFRNDGNNQFTDVDTILGHALISDTGGDLNGGKAVDYDNDGDLDLFFHDHRPGGGKDSARKLYRNDGNWQFTDVTVAEGIDELNQGSYDSPWADIDRDGDQDLIATTDDDSVERVFISSASTNSNHWLYVELAGPSHNSTGIGATLYATLDEGTPQERTIRREANTNAGTFNQSDLPVHFGLGDSDEIDLLKIVWKDGEVQHLADVTVDQYLTIDFADLLPGDYNNDGTVNAADYTVWRDNQGAAAATLANDNDGGIIGQAHYDTWRANYGATAGSGAATAVPEPATVVLMVGLGLLAASGSRGPRRGY